MLHDSYLPHLDRDVAHDLCLLNDELVRLIVFVLLLHHLNDNRWIDSIALSVLRLTDGFIDLHFKRYTDDVTFTSVQRSTVRDNDSTFMVIVSVFGSIEVNLTGLIPYLLR